MTSRIYTIHRITVTVHKQIVLHQVHAIIGEKIGSIGIDEAFDLRIIVAALKIIPACFGIIIIASVAEGVSFKDPVCIRVRIAVGNAYKLAVGIIFVGAKK